MTNTIKVRECCYVCEFGSPVSVNEVFCYRKPLDNNINNRMGYLERCNDFKVMQELQYELE